MKIVQYFDKGSVQLGLLTVQGVLNVPHTLESVLAQGDEGLALLKAYADQKLQDTTFTDYKRMETLTLAPVVSQPEKILCVGLNYQTHLDECKMEFPDYPVIFSKFNNALAAHGEEIVLPKSAEKFDYEAELVIVIGKQAANVSEDEALDYVLGYTVGNDLSARDLQLRTHQWLIGKTCDQFAPVGPYIVTKDELDAGQLNIACYVNDELRQSANTSDMIFSCAKIVSYISQLMTLKPGDLIFTGTPSGVILGYPKGKRNWMKPGDVVRVEIEGIGTLENRLR